MVTETAIKKGYKQTDLGVIPEDWSIVDYVSFGQIIDGDRGIQYPGVTDFKDTGHCLFLNAGNVTKTGFQFVNCQFISADKDRKLNNGKLFRGDVVLTTRGTIGNFAFYCFTTPFEHIRINSGMVILRNTSPKLDNTYQYLVFRSRIVASQIERLSFGSAQPQLTVKGISTLKIPLPPTKAEQAAIAAVLSDADVLIERLEKLIAKKKAIKQGTMQQLLTGKKRLPGFSGDWVLKTMGEIGEITGAGIDKKIRKNEVPIRLVNYLDVFHKDFIYSKDLSHWVTASTAQAQRCALKKGDVFFTPSSEMRYDIAISAVAMENVPDAGYSYHVDRLRLFEDWDLVFRTYIFKTKYFLSQAETICEGSGKRYVISLTRFRGMTVKYPIDKAEQAAIAAILYDMDLNIHNLEQKRDKYAMLKQGMMQQLLTGKIRIYANK